MTASNRKAEQKRLKNERAGQPLTQEQFADLVNAYEVENRQETQVSAYKDGLGRFLKSKGFLVFALFVFPPLALLNGCAYTYNSNTSVSGDSGWVQKKVIWSQSGDHQLVFTS